MGQGYCGRTVPQQTPGTPGCRATPPGHSGVGVSAESILRTLGHRGICTPAPSTAVASSISAWWSHHYLTLPCGTVDTGRCPLTSKPSKSRGGSRRTEPKAIQVHNRRAVGRTMRATGASIVGRVSPKHVKTRVKRRKKIGSTLHRPAPPPPSTTTWSQPPPHGSGRGEDGQHGDAARPRLARHAARAASGLSPRQGTPVGERVAHKPSTKS